MPPVQSRKLTPHQFEYVRLFLTVRKYTPEHIAAAMLCMVEGLTMQAVADSLGFSSRQAVGETVKRVWNLWLEVQGQYVPPPQEPAPKPRKSAARAPTVKAAPGKAGSGAKSRAAAKATASALPGSASSSRKKTTSAVASAKAKK